MATSENRNRSTTVIDPIYQKFSRSVIRALGNTEFYEYFMDAISRADNQFQFSNRKLEKLVDLSWVDAIEEALEGFQNIISNPRNIIREEEIIVNVANARKAGPDVVRHLAQHGSMVENFDEESGEVRPSRLMQKIREDSTELYENRLVYTVLEHTYHFVQIRHNALFDAMNEEYGAKLKVSSELESAKELIHVDMYLHIKEKDTAMETDEKNREVFERISRMYRLLNTFMGSQFAEQMKKINRVKGNVTRTNVLKKNPDYKKIVKLWEFLHAYEDVGYLVKITEQSPYINEKFQQDIFHNIMFQYIILKGYLEDEADRALPKPAKSRKRKVKPKFVREIIEELIEDFDLPDIEIRKVLIEELTKEQLMLEEEAERLRLVEEAEQRRREEEEKRRQEEDAKEALLRAEREERERQELQERMERELEDRRRSDIFRKEILWFESRKLERMQNREDEQDKWKDSEAIQDYGDAARRLEEEEQRKQEEEERKLRKEREAEARRLRKEQEEEERRIRREEERLFQEAMEQVGIYLEEVQYFQQMLAGKQEERRRYEESRKIAMEQARMERSNRQTQKRDEKQQGSRWRFGIR